MLSAPAPPLSRPALTASRAVIYQLLQDRINIGKEMLQISPIDPIEFDNFIEFNIDVLKAMFTNDIIVYEYINSFGPGSLGDKLRRLTNKLESIRDRLDFYTEPGAQAALVMQAPTPRDLSAAAPRDHSKIFVVHGHDGGPKAEVARFIEKLGFAAVILHELPNRGRTIIAKFREEAADVGFAVILMTPDDHGGIAGEDTRPRARQNVIFELGFFIGALGPDRVAALVKGGVEHPSDFDGVGYTELDPRGAWKPALGQELLAAGFKVDWNKVMAG